MCFAGAAVACYDASSASGGVWPDGSGNGNSLVFNGTYAVTAVSGAAGSGVYFDGATYASIGTYSPALGTSFTLAAWVWSTSGGMYLFSVGRGQQYAYNEGAFFLDLSGYAYWWDYGPSGYAFPQTGVSIGWSKNAWNHVAFVRNGLTGAPALARGSRCQRPALQPAAALGRLQARTTSTASPREPAPPAAASHTRECTWASEQTSGTSTRSTSAGSDSLSC